MMRYIEQISGSTKENFISKHVKLLKICLRGPLPSDYACMENSRPTLLFFILSGLDLLNVLNNAIDRPTRLAIIRWIYRLQIDSKSSNSKAACGFRGSFSSTNNCDKNDTCSEPSTSKSFCCYDFGHLAQTYTSLCCLLILEDDLSNVDRKTILEFVGSCQLPNGSFRASGVQYTENDMRFIYCAVAICFILRDFSRIDIKKIMEFIRQSISYDGGIGQSPGLESHGGSTYCALAVLSMLGCLWDGSVLSSKQIERLKNWAIFKQEEGFHGRINKPDDSCYAFWIGASLTILNAQNMVNREFLRCFLMRTQDPILGGFCKYEGSFSDVMHTYLSISALSIFNEPLLHPVFCPLNISSRSYERLLKKNGSNPIING